MQVIIKLYFSFWSDTVTRTRKLIFLQNIEKQYMDQNILIRAKSPHNVCLLSKIGTIYLKNQNNLMDVPKYV